MPNLLTPLFEEGSMALPSKLTLLSRTYGPFQCTTGFFRRVPSTGLGKRVYLMGLSY